MPFIVSDNWADSNLYITAEEVLKVLDEAWLEVSPVAANYFH